jgi:TetR/AcrR family transcriptional repressor of bet genes
MSRKPNTDSRRAEIMAAMLPVLARQGYEKATVLAIARQAGMAPGLIHYHFKSKQHILIALVLAIAEYADARYLNAVKEAKSPLDRLHAYIHSRLAQGEGASADITAAWVMIGAEAVRQAEVREVYQAAIEKELKTLTALLVDCLNEKKKTTSAAPSLAAGLMALMEGAFQLASAAGAVMPKGYAAQAAWDYAVLGVKAAPAVTAKKR